MQKTSSANKCGAGVVTFVEKKEIGCSTSDSNALSRQQIMNKITVHIRLNCRMIDVLFYEEVERFTVIVVMEVSSFLDTISIRGIWKIQPLSIPNGRNQISKN